MINLVICDDEQGVRSMLQNYIERFSAETGELFDVRSFASGTELLAGYPINTDIVLMDVVMGAVNGLETAAEIRRRSPGAIIIFISQSPQFALNAYKVRAFGYLTKPLRYADFRYELSEALKRLRADAGEHLTLRCGGELLRLELNDVRYIEAQNHSYVVYMSGGESHRSVGRLSELEEQLTAQGFFRCHRAYMINLRWLLRLDGSNAELRGGGSVPVSKYRRAELLKSFARYLGERL